MKMNLIIILTAFFMLACGSEKEALVDTEIASPLSPDEPEVTSANKPEVLKAGRYYLPYSGFVDININHDGRYDILARFEILNPDQTICILNLNTSNLTVYGTNLIVYTGGVNLLKNNCRSDADKALETKTGTVFSYLVTMYLKDDLLNVELSVLKNQSNKSTVEINRLIIEE